MATLGEFLTTLFEEGRIVLDGRPAPDAADRPAALRILEAEFEVHALDVAGAPIGFDAPSALAAAELLRLSAWFLVNRSEPAREVEWSLVLPRHPSTAGEHLSADVCFRFLPQIFRRARSVAPGDPLAVFLANLLRAWPLSGVLSDLDEGPEDVGDLGDHPGLWMLYAERLAAHQKPAWMPVGKLRSHVEPVFAGLGLGKSPLLGLPLDASEVGGMSVG